VRSLRSVAFQARDLDVTLLAAATFGHRNYVIEFDVSVLENLATTLTLIVVSANHPEHHLSWNAATNPSECPRFRERLVDEEHWAHVSEYSATLLDIRLCMHDWILRWVELSHLAAEFSSALSVVRPGRELLL